MSIFTRKKREPYGALIIDKSGEHECRPPGCHEFPQGTWCIDRRLRYPLGSVWRCGCGKAWEARMEHLWATWERARQYDEPSPQGGTET